MPEGPEVKVLVRCLNELLKGRNISSFRCNLLSREEENKFPGKLIHKVTCHGKAIYFHIGDFVMYNSLAMTGGWIKDPEFEPIARIETECGVVVGFRDQRKFGKIKILPQQPGGGLDPFSDDWALENFTTLINKHPRKNICAFLLDQHILAGVGNYLKAEILYQCQISPKRKVSTLSLKEILSLYEEIKNIMGRSYQMGGFSMRDYFHLDGSKGEFNPLIYGRTKCPRGFDIIQEKTPDGRITHWCPQVQI